MPARRTIALALLAFALCAVAARAEEKAPFIEVKALAPGVRLDIRYATENNFTHRRVYGEAKCLLRRPVAERLARVQSALAAAGYGLQIFDCFRPLAVQRRFFALVPDERYVADPRKGSRHNRGAAVDLTLVDKDGRPLDMGTDFDDFGPKAHRTYRALPAAVLANRALLESSMAKEGFVGLPTEWWHFDAGDWRKYPIAE